MGKIPTTIPRRQLGRRLRDMRQEARISIQDAARLIERGAGTLQRLEKGEANRIRMLDIQALCQIYDQMDELPGLLELAKVAASKDGEQGLWWNEYGDAIRDDFELYVRLEASASKLTVYRSEIIPGLFQTPEYARALGARYFSDTSSREIEQVVTVRLNRQRIITRRRNPVEVDLLLDESALRRVVGSPKVMAAALRHLADLPANVTVRVLPFSAGFPLGVACGPFVVLDFDRATGEPPTVYVEGYRGNLYYDRAEAVAQYRDTFRTLQTVASPPADSKHMLRRIAREYER